MLNLDRDKLPFEERSIDTIVCIETLEHLQRIHDVLDGIMAVSRKHVICSLPVEAPFVRNRLVDPLGGTFSFATPIAPVFDRHQWAGSVADNLDFVYYRCARNGFAIKGSICFTCRREITGHPRFSTAFVRAGSRS